MSNPRRDRLSKTSKASSYALAIAIHAVILGLMIFNFGGTYERVEAFDAEKIDVVKASAVDEQEVKKQLDQLKQADAKREKDRQDRLDELARLEQEQEKKEQDIADLEKRQVEEQKRTEQAEAQRKAIELKKREEERKAEEERKEREAAAKKERERLAREKREREAEAERQRLAAQQAFEEQLEAEQRAIADKRARERTTMAENQTISEIEKKINARRNVDPSFEPWLKSVVEVRVDPQGNVLSVRTIESSGNPRFDSASEGDVYKVSPLPLPDQTLYPDAYKRFVDESFELIMSVPR